MARDPCTARYQPRIEPQEQYRAREAELLGEDGEDKIRGLFGQEVEPRLRTLEKTLAPRPARAYRDFGLNYVIARTERVGLRVHEAHQPFALVGLEKMPSSRRHQHRAQPQHCHRAPSKPACEDECGGDEDQNHRRSQVWLLKNERDRQPQQDCGKYYLMGAPAAPGRFFPQVPHITKTTASLATSDGSSLKNPRLSQRREPPVTWPATETKASRATVPPYIG